MNETHNQIKSIPNANTGMHSNYLTGYKVNTEYVMFQQSNQNQHNEYQNDPYNELSYFLIDQINNH